MKRKIMTIVAGAAGLVLAYFVVSGISNIIYHHPAEDTEAQDEMAEKIDRAAKYYADIERGSCGMSVETLMALSETLDMSLDYIIYGKNTEENGYPGETAEVSAILTMLNNSEQRERDYALRLLKLFLASRK